MKKKMKSIRSLIDDLDLGSLDLDALKKKLKFKRKKKMSRKKWAVIALAALGAVVAAKMYAKSRKA
jgi:hypothetical protein